MTEKKYVALTFDDGPNTTVTPEVLKRLKKYGVVATFFVNGVNITDDSASVMKKAVDIGCEIENHSQNHLHMNTLDAKKMIDEIESTDNLVEKHVGRKPLFFRPPFIDVNSLMFETIDKTFICGFCPNDWSQDVTKEQTVEGVIKNITNGGIILLHDSAYNLKTALALDTIIPKLQSDGYEFLTVSKLFEKFNITPKNGVVYSNVNDK